MNDEDGKEFVEKMTEVVKRSCVITPPFNNLLATKNDEVYVKTKIEELRNRLRIVALDIGEITDFLYDYENSKQGLSIAGKLLQLAKDKLNKVEVEG